MNDLISRQAAIAHLKQRLYETQLNNDTEHPYYEEIADNRIDVWMNEVPSVQPEQKRGKWIESTELSEQVKEKKFCSNCGKAQYAIEITDKTIQIKSGTSKFCPNCGAEMEE